MERQQSTEAHSTFMALFRKAKKIVDTRGEQWKLKLGKFKGPTVNNLDAFKLRSLFYGQEKRDQIVLERVF